MKFVMTSIRYYEISHFLTDSNEICTAHAKLVIRHSVREHFFFFRNIY